MRLHDHLPRLKKVMWFCSRQRVRASTCLRVSNTGEGSSKTKLVSRKSAKKTQRRKERMARKLAPDKWLFAATVGLALFGVVMVYSASAVLAQKENGNQLYYVIKQGVWLFVGFIVMFVAMQFNYQGLRNRRLLRGLRLICPIGSACFF